MPWKWLLILGLGATFAGLVLMIQGRMYENENGMKALMPVIMHPIINKLGWGLTIAGYLAQIIGVIMT